MKEGWRWVVVDGVMDSEGCVEGLRVLQTVLLADWAVVSLPVRGWNRSAALTVAVVARHDERGCRGHAAGRLPVDGARTHERSDITRLLVHVFCLLPHWRQ